ncbi:hypothetical protein [Streptomyces sp. ISL-98]|nr:hypothetical protein [Streptomyces sp. ISL-98]
MIIFPDQAWVSFVRAVRRGEVTHDAH